MFLYGFFFFLVIYFVSLHKRDSDSVGFRFLLVLTAVFCPWIRSILQEMQTRLHDFTSFSTGLLADLERSEQCQNKVPISLCHWHRTEQRASCVLSLSRSAVNCLCSGAALLHIHSLWGPVVFYCFSIIADHVIWQFFFFCFSSVFLRFWTECSPVCRPTEQSSSRESQRRTKIRWCPGVNLCALCVY